MRRHEIRSDEKRQEVKRDVGEPRCQEMVSAMPAAAWACSVSLGRGSKIIK